ncbi:SIS domain-containing protein [bacterium]|nr:SIS domain-containing protein [bacterium]
MDFLEIKERVIKEISSTLDKVEEANELVEEIVSASKVFVVGSGRTKLMIEAFAKRLGHLGVDAHVVGAIVQPTASKDNLLIIASGSGKSLFPLSIAKKAKEINMRIALITDRKESEISKISDLTVYIPASIKQDSPTEKKSFQPLNNLFEQSLLIFCDIIAILIQKKKGLENQELLKRHANLE